MNTTTNTRGVSEAMVAELIASGDFLAMNGTDGMVRRWERAKAALSAQQGHGEAVAEVCKGAFGIHYIACADPNKLPAGTKLYTAPAAQPAERVPEGMVLIDREFIENADAALGLSTVDGEHWTEHESPRFELRMALGLPHEVPASPAAPADGDGKEGAR